MDGLERFGQDAPEARLTTRFIRDPRDLIEHFDRLAPEYLDAHGPAERLLAYRLSTIRRFLADGADGDVARVVEQRDLRRRTDLAGRKQGGPRHR
jgi:hypothetical protein